MVRCTREPTTPARSFPRCWCATRPGPWCDPASTSMRLSGWTACRLGWKAQNDGTRLFDRSQWPRCHGTAAAGHHFTLPEPGKARDSFLLLCVKSVRVPADAGYPVTERPAESPVNRQPVDQQAAEGLLARALRRARWTILWERLWPALASLATAVGLFLALSWAGVWLVLPPIGRAIGLFLLLALAAVSSVPLFRFRLPNAYDGLRRLDRASGLKHRPATTIADEIATSETDQVSLALWRAHVERALRAVRTLKAGVPRPRLPPLPSPPLVALASLLSFLRLP